MNGCVGPPRMHTSYAVSMKGIRLRSRLCRIHAALLLSEATSMLARNNSRPVFRSCSILSLSLRSMSPAGTAPAELAGGLAYKIRFPDTKRLTNDEQQTLVDLGG